VSQGGGDQQPVIDGRILRSQRTRAKLIDALISLIEDGDLRPTAPRIAERAGVSMRSIYHHFDDLELLFADATARQLERIAPLLTRLPATGPVEDRVAALVGQRARIYEAVAQVRRASVLQEPFSAQIQAARASLHSRSRRELAAVFEPELSGRDQAAATELLDALDAAANWTSWNTMRTDMHLSMEDAERVLRRTLAALLQS
jgi:TetR/AcrR family transcriptional regulator, regulator of autoinduction and epiphytic fitness